MSDCVGLVALYKVRLMRPTDEDPPIEVNTSASLKLMMYQIKGILQAYTKFGPECTSEPSHREHHPTTESPYNNPTAISA